MKRSQTSLLIFVGLTIAALVATLVAGWHPSLGLDLQGGASVVLQPTTKVSGETLDQTIAIIRSRVDALGVAEPEIARQGDAVVVQLPGVKDTTRALKIVGETAELRFRPVLGDLPSESAITAAATASTTTTKPGSTSRVVTVSSTAPGATTTTAAGATTTVAAGAATTDAAATTTTAAATTTAAPSSADEQAIGAVGRFGSARVRAQTDTTAAPTTAAATTTIAPTTTAGGATITTVAGATSTTVAGATTTTVAGATTTTVAGATTTTVPSLDLPGDISKTTSIEDDKKEATVVLPYKERSATAARYLLGPAELTGDVVSDAYAQLNQGGGWVTVVELNSKGSAAWDAMANKYYQQRIAIVLDGVVYSAPVIQARQFNGRAEISGADNAAEAKDLATKLKYGALPVQLKPATVQTVSATLGRDSLHAGLLTGGLGLLLVAAYMVFYYRRMGLIVILGMFMSAALMWVVVSWLSESRGLALSLSGAVGIIVSVGITVDSYVVYFERLRDEQRGGRTLAASVDRAFKDAWRTILAADLTSLIGASVLYFLTVGSVRGFAFFLMISTCLDMTVAYFFTRPIVAILGRRGWFGGGADPSVSRGPIPPGGGGRLRPGVAAASSSSTGGQK